MARIVYLFGAGASVGCIPAVSGMIDGFTKIRSWISQPDRKKEMFDQHGISTSNIEQDLEWLIEISRHRASIDTVARSFFLQGNDEGLRRLKISLSAYLQIEQAENPVDKRYDLFLASIFKDSSFYLPNEIKVLSWNYDNQFELGFNAFLRNKQDLHNRDRLRILDKYANSNPRFADTFIYKLNGSSGLTFSRKRRSNGYPSGMRLHEIIKEFQSQKETLELEPGISFAWEFPELAEQRVPELLDSCEIIVTIGYSFPFFNREIDKMIFKEAKSLRKVYIQNPNASEIEEKLKNLIDPSRKVQFVQDTSKHEFLIPYEL